VTPAPQPPEPTPEQDKKTKGVFDGLVIAQDVTEAVKTFKQRKPATFSLKSDHVGRSDTYNVQGTVMWQDPFNWVDFAKSHPAEWWIPELSPYLTVSEKTNKDPAKKVDDFTVGMEFEGRLTRITPLYIDASWITDLGHFSSSQYLLSARVVPPLYFLPAYGSYPTGVRPDKFTVLPVWDFAPVMDYSDVARPGSKTALLNVPQYTRLGFNADGAIRFGFGSDSSSFMLSTDYQYRNELSSRPADATLWSFGLEYKPSDSSPFSFSVTYEYGKKIDTLALVKEWNASIGFKH
jgi:hypothetical protein